MAICLFRAIGALSRDLVVANACGSLALLTIMLMGGFVIPKSSVHPWVVWLYWIDPLQWAQRAITINEFSASRWGGLGPAILQIRAFPNHYWYVPQQPRKGQAWLADWLLSVHARRRPPCFACRFVLAILKCWSIHAKFVFASETWHCCMSLKRRLRSPVCVPRIRGQLCMSREVRFYIMIQHYIYLFPI